MFDIVVASVPVNFENWNAFLVVLLLVFALFLILAGIFTAYFGSGKSRTIGVALLVVGLIVGILVGYLYGVGDFGAKNGAGLPTSSSRRSWSSSPASSAPWSRSGSSSSRS